MSETYRIVPGWITDYRLEVRRRFLFWTYWSYVTNDNSYARLFHVVSKTGGKLSTHNPEKEE